MPNQYGAPDHKKLAMGDMRMKINKQRYGQSDLESKMEDAKEAGGGIQPNAHPEFNEPTPLDKLISGAKKLFGGKNATR